MGRLHLVHRVEVEGAFEGQEGVRRMEPTIPPKNEGSPGSEPHHPNASSEVPLDSSELSELIYDELRGLAFRFLRRERANHTLQATALAHEAYLRIVSQNRSSWDSLSQFKCIASTMIRRVLVNYERDRKRLKRGGDRKPVTLHESRVLHRNDSIDLLALDEALARLAELDPRQARIVELRFFGGLSIDECAEALDVSPRTVDGEWAMAKRWLQITLGED